MQNAMNRSEASLLLFLGHPVFVAVASVEDIFKRLLVSSASSLPLSARYMLPAVKRERRVFY